MSGEVIFNFFIVLNVNWTFLGEKCTISTSEPISKHPRNTIGKELISALLVVLNFPGISS